MNNRNNFNNDAENYSSQNSSQTVSYTHLDVYKRQTAVTAKLNYS